MNVGLFLNVIAAVKCSTGFRLYSHASNPLRLYLKVQFVRKSSFETLSQLLMLWVGGQSDLPSRVLTSCE